MKDFENLSSRYEKFNMNFNPKTTRLLEFANMTKNFYTEYERKSCYSFNFNIKFTLNRYDF